MLQIDSGAFPPNIKKIDQHFDLVIVKITRKLNYRKDDRAMRAIGYISGSNEPLRRYGHSHILGHMEPNVGGRGGRRGSAMALERATVVSYRLSIVTVALSVTIRPQFAIECLYTTLK